MIVLNVPLLYGKIKRNYWYGFRIPKSFESEENWLAINVYSARRFIQWSLGFFVMSAIVLVIPIATIPWIHIVVSILIILFVSLPIIDVILYARKL